MALRFAESVARKYKVFCHYEYQWSCFQRITLDKYQIPFSLGDSMVDKPNLIRLKIVSHISHFWFPNGSICHELSNLPRNMDCAITFLLRKYAVKRWRNTVERANWKELGPFLSIELNVTFTRKFTPTVSSKVFQIMSSKPFSSAAKL